RHRRVQGIANRPQLLPCLAAIGRAQQVQQVVAPWIGVMSDKEMVAIARVYGHADIAAGALIAEKAIKIECRVLRHAYTRLAVARVDQIGEGSRASAAVIIA